jgi:CheY-like chemotaxis protein
VPGNTSGLRVLVVDDLSEMRAIIHRALSDRGYVVDVAATIEQARAMSPGGYDAVLVDAHLGRERGTDLVEALLAEDPGIARRCLLMTGGTTGALPGGIAYLAKPFQLGELIDAVGALHQPRPAPARQRPAASSATTGAHPAPAMPPGAPAAATPLPGAQQPAAPLPGAQQPAAPLPGAQRQAGGGPHAWQLLGITRRLRARERHELVDFLHDGPIQELTAVTLELQMTCRSLPDASRFDAVLQRLDAAAGSLRWLADGQWPFLAPETQLAAALRQRTAWLLAAPVTVSAEAQAAGLTAMEVPIVIDVVELMLLGMVTADPPALAHVTVRAETRLIQIDLILMSAAGDNRAIGDPQQARAALDSLASALGTDADARLRGHTWRAQITLPREVALVPGRSGQARE